MQVRIKEYPVYLYVLKQIVCYVQYSVLCTDCCVCVMYSTLCVTYSTLCVMYSTLCDMCSTLFIMYSTSCVMYSTLYITAPMYLRTYMCTVAD